MKRTIRVISVIIAFSIVLSSFIVPPVQAAEIERFYSSQGDEGEIAEAEKELKYSFDVDVSCSTSIAIVAVKKCDIHLVLQNSAGQLIADKILSGKSADFEEQLEMYSYFYKVNLKQAKGYKLRLTFSEENQFTMVIGRASLEHKMQPVTITKGFSERLNPGKQKVKKWKSSNTKIVSVKNGKIVAKKVGTATITATIKDTFRLTWKIKVEDNIYEEDKIELSPKDEKKKYIQVYKAYYSGNKMMIHIRIVNNTPVEYIQLQNLEFYVKTADGKGIASYKEAKRDIIIPAKSVKHLTVTIDHPQKKKADLRRAKVTFHDGTLFHYK